MSKCGLCGEDFGSRSHMVIECRVTLTDEIKERINEWLVKEKDLKEAASIMHEIKESNNGIL